MISEILIGCQVDSIRCVRRGVANPVKKIYRLANQGLGEMGLIDVHDEPERFEPDRGGLL